MSESTLDVLVIGGGPGGYRCAARAAELGLNVALADAADLGGVCLNRGCIPTKGLLAGPDADGIVGRVARNAEAVAALRKGVATLLKRVTVLTGHARITGPGMVEVAGHGEVAARHIVIATGAFPKALPVLPFDGERVWSSDHAVAVDAVPERLAVIGSGAVGLEFADVFASYGAQVTVIEAEARLLPTGDAWLAKHLGRAFKARGIDVLTGARVTGAEIGKEISLTVETAKGAQRVEADRALVAVGRSPNVDGIGLEAVGLTADSRGIAVDGFGRTGVAGVFAIGDVTEPPQLAHRAEWQGRVVAEVIAGANPRPLDDATIPACVYTHPQLASVGLGPDDAGGLVAADAIFRANGLAVVTGDVTGGVRLVADAGGVLKGAQLAGNGVTEMVGLLGALIRSGVTVHALAGTVFPHPTLSETVHQAAEALVRRL